MTKKQSRPSIICFTYVAHQMLYPSFLCSYLYHDFMRLDSYIMVGKNFHAFRVHTLLADPFQ